LFIGVILIMVSPLVCFVEFCRIKKSNETFLKLRCSCKHNSIVIIECQQKIFDGSFVKEDRECIENSVYSFFKMIRKSNPYKSTVKCTLNDLKL